MNILTQIKNFFINNFAVLTFYILSFSTFEGLKEFPDLIIFSFNLPMIMVYFYTLKFPEYLGYEHFFLAGIINDVVTGIPLGTSALSYLMLAFFTSYMREATIRAKMTTEWITFIPGLFFANLVYFVIITHFSHFSFYYIELLQVTFFTFLFFPIFYFLLNKFQQINLKADAKF